MTALERPSDLVREVATASRLGKAVLDEATRARVQHFVTQTWEKKLMRERQAVIDEMWAEIGANLGEEGRADLARYRAEYTAAVALG